MKYIIILLSLLAFSYAKFDFLKVGLNEVGNHYAVLVAGSNGFWNYRHQSDIFHAYHILLKNGIPKENIIVFAYDDIANSSQNPIKGKVFNKPHPSGEGVDVYEGVNIDYKGNDVIPENFLAVLEGDEAKLKGKGTGRVLKSTGEDNVFVYFSDHGAPGLIAFPNGELYSDSLMATLKKMHAKNSYKKLVFYLEACESGSMFEKILPANINVYATSAANSNESSYAIYCSPDDVIGKVHIGSCLGDEYSVNWMEDSDNNSNKTESLETQYETVKSKTKGSHVLQWGSKDFVNENIWDFQGNQQESKYGFLKKIKKFIRQIVHKITGKPEHKEIDPSYSQYLEEAKKSKINSRDVKLFYLYQRAMTLNDEYSSQELQKELEHIKKSDKIFAEFDKLLVISAEKEIDEIKFDCLRPAVEAYKSICLNWGEYDLKYVRNIAHACSMNYSYGQIVRIFKLLC
jgi:legumain